MLIVRDENKLRAPSVCRRGRFSFILTALNSSVWQDSSWSDMNALRWLITVSSTFEDVDFDGSLLPVFIT